MIGFDIKGIEDLGDEAG